MGEEKVELPGYLWFTWMVFMQPRTLDRMLPDGIVDFFAGDATVWDGDPRERELFVRAVRFRFGFALAIAVGLVAASWTVEMLFRADFHFTTCLAIGVLIGAVAGVFFQMQYTLPIFISWGAALGVAWNLVGDVSMGATLTVLVGVLVTGVSRGLLDGGRSIFSRVLEWCIMSLFISPLLFVNLVIYLFEAVGVSCASAAPSSKLVAVSVFLPFRHHDMIELPIPGLTRFLLRLAEVDPALAQVRITEAADTIAQGPPARRALIELQCRELERSAAERRWSKAAALDLPFHAAATTLPADDPLVTLAHAAEDLRAAAASRNHLHRRRQLDKARAGLDGLRIRVTRDAPTDALSQRLYPVIATWLRIVDDEQAALTRDLRDNSQVPTAFVAGPVLTPDDRDLFKGRRDLADLIDHDLTRDLRAPLVLQGHRRMGKSSLLNLLPLMLGSGTRVVVVDFKGLSGAPGRSRPHQWLAAEVQRQLPQAVSPPESDVWHPVRDWLIGLDQALPPNERLILAIDEVEKLQEGVQQGWATLDVLSMFRDLGDRLRRTRLVLVTARRLDRIGPGWTDPLITSQLRRLSWLDEHEAIELLTQPIPEFPAIWPDGAVARVLEQTNRHPYLLQLVGDRLVARLNQRGVQVATDDDVDAAIDNAIDSQTVFRELWETLDPAEQGVVQALAHDAPVVDSPAVRSLRDEQHVTGAAGAWRLAVPMFATWVRVHIGPPEASA